jgi:hypothetical protein
MTSHARPPSERIVRALLRGAAAGVIATVPMSLVMYAWHRQLPASQRYPLPPRLITDRIVGRAPLPDWAPPPGPGRTLAAHFAFGAGVGALYAAADNPLGRHYPAATGVGYGLLVWAASYLGWVPAAGLMPPATRQPAARNAMMIAAHIVWGASLGIAFHALRDRLRADRHTG